MGAEAPQRAIRVVIDARLYSGESGGVEAVLLGLAHGLSQLSGPETYSFAVWEGHEAWLKPFVSGSAGLVVQPLQGPPTTAIGITRRRIGDAAPALRSAWHAVRALVPGRDLPGRDHFIEGLQPDVVHQLIQHAFIPTVPAIYHPHDLQHVHLPEFFTTQERESRERWYGTLCRQAAMVAVSSEWTRRDVMSHFDLPSRKVHVVPLAPPLAASREPTREQRLEVRRRYGLPRQYMLYPAQTWGHKNHLRLLEALAILRDRDGLVVPLVCSGFQNAFFARIAERSRQLGLQDQVVWTGFVAPLELRALYLEAHAIVIPSLFEAASGPLWEAFLSGVPAACSNVTSLPDQAGDAAVVFDPTDPAKISEAIATIWRDERLRSALVVRGRRQVGGLSWERTARSFRAHYRRLAGVTLAEDETLLVDANASMGDEGPGA